MKQLLSFFLIILFLTTMITACSPYEALEDIRDQAVVIGRSYQAGKLSGTEAAEKLYALKIPSTDNFNGEFCLSGFINYLAGCVTREESEYNSEQIEITINNLIELDFDHLAKPGSVIY